jgi:putative tryptophan/tyrosine transport system substrate-binding protein
VADYVDRVLRDAQPDQLPVQGSIKFETPINLKTAKKIGLEVPLSIQVQADKIVE